MPVEIEHKFLLDLEKWKNLTPEDTHIIRQGYLYSDSSKTIRVRTAGEHAFITIKGKSSGYSRPEYEYEIPLRDANELLELFCDKVIEKTRHGIHHAGHYWEVDIFAGENEGLAIAEIELSAADELYAVPDWVTKNVSDDSRYGNASLIENPYARW